MKRAYQERVRAMIVLCLPLSVLAVSIAARLQEPPVRPVVIYLDDGPFVIAPQERNGVAYLPLTPLARRLALPYTDATATGRFTIGGPRGTLTLERETGIVTLDGTELELGSPALHEDGQWLVPEEFLARALGPMLGIGFSAMPYRIIAANVPSTSLEMEAVAAGGVTQLTLRLGDSSNVRVQQDPEDNRVTLNIDRAPVVPEREVLDYRDASIRSVFFDDSDGQARIVVETTPQVVNLRLIPSDGNRTFLLELVPADAPVAAVVAAPAPGTPRESVGDSPDSGREPIQTIVIDPGHGGLDSGTQAGGSREKDLTLVLARRLQATLEERLGTTVILTRERDVGVTLAARTAIANENRADLFLSLHTGFSHEVTESQARVFVMRDPDRFQAAQAARDLFTPWFTAHHRSRDASLDVARMLARRLASDVPEWPSGVESAPLGVLAGATMPAAVAELGNMNNPDDVASLLDPSFQNRVIEAVVETVLAWGSDPDGGDTL